MTTRNTAPKRTAASPVRGPLDKGSTLIAARPLAPCIPKRVPHVAGQPARTMAKANIAPGRPKPRRDWSSGIVRPPVADRDVRPRTLTARPALTERVSANDWRKCGGRPADLRRVPRGRRDAGATTGGPVGRPGGLYQRAVSGRLASGGLAPPISRTYASYETVRVMLMDTDRRPACRPDATPQILIASQPLGRIAPHDRGRGTVPTRGWCRDGRLSYH